MVSVSGEQAIAVEGSSDNVIALPLERPVESGFLGRGLDLSSAEGALEATSDRVWAGGFRFALDRRRRLDERLSRAMDPDRFRTLAIERDCLNAFLAGEAGTADLARKIRHLSAADQAAYATGLERPRALFAAAAERQLALLPTRDDVPRPRERVIRDEVEAACWTAFREGADALVWRVDALGHQASSGSLHALEQQVASVLERSILSSLYGGSRALASALRRRKGAAETGLPERRRAARLAASVLGPMLEVLLRAEGAV